MMYSVLMCMLIGSAHALTNIRPSIKSFKYVGSTKPFEKFDPLNIIDGKGENRVKYTRDSSMLGINYLNSLDAYHQAPVWLGLASYEVIRMGRGWVNPFTTNTTFQLKTDYQPGNLGNYDVETISDDMFNKELNNGRLAMVGFMGIVGQELVTQSPVF